MQQEKIEMITEKIMKKFPETRDHNNLLTIKVLKELGFYINIDIDDLIQMPSFESISRAGRKIKELNPNLKGSNSAEKRKEELEEEYRMKYSSYKNPTEDFFNTMRSGLR